MHIYLLTGFVLAIISAATFGASGALAKGLLVAGWSPAAAVTGRVAIGALLLLPAALHSLRGRWYLLHKGWLSILLFGVTGVAVCQLAYFLAVQRLSVGVALLLEYCAIILIVAWIWLRHRQRPRLPTLIGTALALAGLVLILDLFGTLTVDPLGVMWGLIAAIGLATYFIVSAEASHAMPPLVLAAGGLLVGTLLILAAGVAGMVDLNWNTHRVVLAGVEVHWWLDVLALGIVAAAIAYLTGIIATRRLGTRMASFLGLSEVLFAVLWAWLLLAEMPRPIQLLGGVLILTGIAVVRLDRTPTVGADTDAAGALEKRGKP